MVSFWMHFTVYICGGIVACAWWNWTILTWKCIRMECRRRVAHHLGDLNGTSRRIAVSNVVCDKGKKKKQNGGLLLLLLMCWYVGFSSMECNDSYMKVHQNWIPNAGGASVRRSKRYNTSIRAVSYRIINYKKEEKRMAVCLSLSHCELLHIYSMEWHNSYMKVHQNWIPNAGGASVRRSKRTFRFVGSVSNAVCD